MGFVDIVKSTLVQVGFRLISLLPLAKVRTIASAILLILLCLILEDIALDEFYVHLTVSPSPNKEIPVNGSCKLFF